jgi:hypothetical protein
MLRSSRWVLPTLLFALSGASSTLRAQWQSNTGPGGASLGATVGGDVERYLRALALSGIIKPVPWGTRPFGADDLVVLLNDTSGGAHPWAARLRSTLNRRVGLGVSASGSANSGFPWGSNDGAMWQGRGLNGAIGVAATLRWRNVTLVAAPLAFVSQNASFPQLPQNASSVSPFADPLFPGNIDLPQRMGAGGYARLDPGESSIRLHTGPVVMGVSSASLGWGTGESFPGVLGPNAGGFPHFFAGTRGRGTRVPFIGYATARYIFGLLQQTAWSPVQGSDTYVSPQESGTMRTGAGLTLTLAPVLLPDLELGASRFFHSPYLGASNRWSAWSKPFEGIFKKGFGNRDPGGADPSGDADNQLASFFARWVFPSRGFEANFELLREDHNWDARDLAQEPENNSAVLASIRAKTHSSGKQLAILTLEYFDGDVRPIAQARAQGYLYISGGLLQGHTQRGQLLGSPIGAGAVAGSRASWERFTDDGSFRVNFQRWRSRSVRTQDGQGLFLGAGSQVPKSHDWIIDGSAALTQFHKSGTRSVEGGLAWAGRFNLDASRLNLYTRASWSLF